MRTDSSPPTIININIHQPCPVCGFLIGIVAGSKDAVCKNCGFKDPCCE